MEWKYCNTIDYGTSKYASGTAHVWMLLAFTIVVILYWNYMIQPERIQYLNACEKQSGAFVVYWMQQAQRTCYNHALAYAIENANELGLPLVVYFGLTPHYPGANVRHYAFMLEGLAAVKQALDAMGIVFVVRVGNPVTELMNLAQHAALVVTDRGYTSIQRRWREEAAHMVHCPLVQVETDVVVPVETVSEKEEYSAGTIRKKIERQLNRFLVPLEAYEPLSRLTMPLDSIDISDWKRVLASLPLDTSVSPVTWITGGQDRAEQLLETFIDKKLRDNDTLRNDPSRDYCSHLSPYLHFGQISPLYVALKVSRTGFSAAYSFLDELIVRRELAINFVYYNTFYQTYESVPAWAQKTLEKHQKDRRAYVYSRAEFENAQTHDPYWNAAQTELMCRGTMHGYMRMYWGKKIIEWSASPGEALDIATYLNDKYALDGRDPNGYAGIHWCFGKHDRPWQERPIFGTVRYMNDRGLERKFDIKAYVRWVEEVCSA